MRAPRSLSRRLRGVVVAALVLALLPARAVHAEQWGDYPPFTRWYENPLGFYPLVLHASNGLIVPALVAGIGLVLDRKASFPRTVSLYGQAGSSWGYTSPFTTIVQTNVGALYRVRSWLSLGVQFDLYVPFDSVNGTIAVGARPFARFYLIDRRRFRAFVQSGAGLAYFAAPFPGSNPGPGIESDPRTGTHLNGTPVYGAGMEWNDDSSWSVFGGIQHVHVSNGGLAGEGRHPAHDSNGFFLGLLRTLP